MQRLLPYLWYPGLFGFAIAAFAWLLARGYPPTAAAYFPTVIVGLAIVLLEFVVPEHQAWRPRWSHVRVDTAFLALVQIALPQGLAALVVVGIARWMHTHAASSLWPHHWPLWLQIAMVVLAVDLMRYWLHRACHHFPTLWRLHEVHHSPEILYVLNTGRFHPLEKTLHFGLDTAPFLLLGVRPEVIAGYFLMYSVNGLFQHSNIRLRYGWLNYLVGSAETHRWHHAKDPQVAACNFSNTTIIWDLVFGTWRLPRRCREDEIGISDANYPQNFWAQLAAPFRRSEARSAGAGSRLATLLLRTGLAARHAVSAWQIRRAAEDPMATQRALLQRIVRSNADTAFGREHGFAELRTIEDFQRRVPVREYEALRPYIAAEIATGEKSLTRDPPVRYVRTSGTTGQPKDIPLTEEYLRALRRIQRTALAFQFRRCPEAFDGRLLGMIGSPTEGRLPNGRPYGALSGLLAGDSPAAVRQRLVLPPAVFEIEDNRVRYLLILRLALACGDLSYIGSANATTLLTLLRLYREHRAALIEDIQQGTFVLEKSLPAEVRSAVADRLQSNPARAAELNALDADATLSELWPNLRLIVTWTCASAGLAAAALRSELSSATRVLELGYIASEFRGTITIGRRAESGLPTLDTHFFEFVTRDDWERGEPRYLTLDQLEKGGIYYVVITSPSGLYRYFMNDLVTVRGFLHRTPLLKFLQKGQGVTNITGEKLYEAQVLDAVQRVVASRGRTVRFVMAIADEAAFRYRVYVATDAGARPPPTELAEAVDASLRKINLEYRAKRDSDRLKPLSAEWVRSEIIEAYKQYKLQQHQREAQFKIVAIAYGKDMGFDFKPFVEK